MKNKFLYLILALALCTGLLVGCAASAEGVGQLPQSQSRAELTKQLDSQAEGKKTVSQQSITLCEVCGDDDCDDGIFCDDAHEKQENLREAENRKNGVRCEICGDYDCDDSKYCDDWDDLAENLLEEENRKNGIRCGVCGDYDCDDGKYCDDWHEQHHKNEHHRGHHD